MMADGAEFSIVGVESLQAKLDEMTFDVKRRGGRFALRKAAQVLQAQIQANAKKLDDPATAEDIAANIAVRWSGRTFKRTGNLAFRIGVLGGARNYAPTRENARKGRVGEGYSTGGDKTNPGGDTWYWRFLEFGTSRTQAHPFVRPAANQAGAAVLAEFLTQYEKAIDRAIRRAAKKGNK